jgi:hypothetical protein
MKVVVTYSKVLSQHSPGVAVEKHENLRILDIAAEIINGHLPNANQKSPFSYPSHLSGPPEGVTYTAFIVM